MPTHTPWAGLAALVFMFLLPFLPAWLFEGPRKVKHWPQRHVCGECGAPWAGGHLCAEEAVLVDPAPPLRGDLRRVRPKGEVQRRPEARIVR